MLHTLCFVALVLVTNPLLTVLCALTTFIGKTAPSQRRDLYRAAYGIDVMQSNLHLVLSLSCNTFNSEGQIVYFCLLKGKQGCICDRH